MNDAPDPFGREAAKAAQEIAKASSNAIDAAREAAQFFNRVLGNPIADAVGMTVGDPLRFVRILSIDWYSRKVEEILKTRGSKKLAGAPPRLAIEILDAAQDETRDELRELWARLIANAMDETTCKTVRIEFVSILKQLNPLDALVLQKLAAHANFISPYQFSQAQHLDSNDAATSFLYLYDLKCLQQNTTSNYEFMLSPRGLALLKAIT